MKVLIAYFLLQLWLFFQRKPICFMLLKEIVESTHVQIFFLF